MESYIAVSKLGDHNISLCVEKKKKNTPSNHIHHMQQEHSCILVFLFYIMFTKSLLYNELSTTKHYFMLHVCINSNNGFMSFTRVSVVRCYNQLEKVSYA